MLKFVALCIFSMLMFSSAYGASSGLNSYLSTYMPNSTINSYKIQNTTINGSTYTIMVNSNNNYLLVNDTGGAYRLMTNKSDIDAVLTSFYSASSNINESELSYLKAGVRSYYSKSSANITDCITETAISPPYTNNLQNASNACSTVPVCHKVLNDVGGPDSPFGLGLVNFSIDYSQLNNSINSYENAALNLSSNPSANIKIMDSELSNITLWSSKLPQNPLFPPPQSTNFGKCSGAAIPTQQPWYCVATGYCGAISFNSTLLNKISSTQNKLASQIPSSAQIEANGASAALSASSYITSAITKKNQTAYYLFINSTYPTYNKTVRAAMGLLKNVSDSNLTVELNKLEVGYKSIMSGGINQSITSANTLFYALVANTTKSYEIANTIYMQDSSAASNATLASISDQLNYKIDPVKLSMISYQIFTIDTQLGSGNFNQTTLNQVVPTLRTDEIALALYHPIFTMASFEKWLEGPIITSLLAGSNASIYSKTNSAPIYAFIITLIIDLLIIFVIYYFTYHRLSKRNKIHRHGHVVHAWRALFAILIIIAIVDAYTAMSYAAVANSHLPFAYFMSTLKSSNSAYIALNGTLAYGNSSIAACASEISSILKSQGKAVNVISITNGSCVENGAVSGLGVDCYDAALSKGIPVVVLSAQGQGIEYSGMYGYNLYVNGPSASTQSCIASALISKEG